jgi:hypothetical protein
MAFVERAAITDNKTKCGKCSDQFYDGMLGYLVLRERMLVYLLHRVREIEEDCGQWR